MVPATPTDRGLVALAQDFREALRHSIYLVRRLDAGGDLSAAQLSTLKMLLDDGVRVGEIARNLGVKVPSATEQIIKLERAGLARRDADPDDSRAVRVTLTAEAGPPSNTPMGAATPSWPGSCLPSRTATAPPSRPPFR
jgi:DNA-binding MarR family transcriptional regulator